MNSSDHQIHAISGLLLVTFSLSLMSACAANNLPSSQNAGERVSSYLPVEDIAVWHYKVVLVDSQGIEQTSSSATIELNRVSDLSFGQYFTPRSDEILDTCFTSGPFEINMTFTARAEGSQFWHPGDDQRRIWFENADGLFAAFKSIQFDFWLITKLLPEDSNVGDTWGTSVDSYSRITSIDSVLIGGSYQQLYSVDWIHAGTPWQHSLHWARGIGLVESHDWIVRDYEQTGERYVYRRKLQPDIGFEQ